MQRAWLLPLLLLCIGITGYVALSRLTFAAPIMVSKTTDTNNCGFNPADCTAAATGAMVGSSIPGVLALCLGCLAPTLSAVGLWAP